MRARRQGAVATGAALAVASVVALVVGFVLIGATQAIEVAAAEGRARVGNAVSFDADARTYVVIFTPDPGTEPFVGDRLAQLDCVATYGDGTVDEIDTRSTAERTTTSIGTVAATFDGREGTVEVRCEWRRGSGLSSGSYSVAVRHTKARLAAYGAIGLGTAAGIAAAVALTIGFRGRQVVVDLPDTTEG